MGTKNTLYLVVALAAMWMVGTISAVPAIIAGIIGYIALGGYHTIWLAYMTLPRDLRAGWRYLRLRFMIRWAQGSDYCLADLFERNVTKNPHKVALIWEGKKWTFKQLSDYSNRVADVLKSKGLRHGDCVALVMTNRPEYVATWLGASKLGVVTALINHNLKHRSLYHCIAVGAAKAVVCSLNLIDSITEVASLLQGIPVLVSCADGEPVPKEYIDMDALLNKASNALPEELAFVHFADKMLYIYTSGTTGLPKAAVITSARYLFFCGGVQFMVDLSPDDIIYNPLPLYHTAGGMVGMGQVLVFNATAIIKTKLSVSQYWKECGQYNCTVAQYVGEVCRYLLNSPPQPTDTQHKVRVMYGNGVRPQIWEEFTRRFNMPCIAEFYGATESNANIMNYEGKPGACGFISLLFPQAYPVTLIRVNEKTGVPVRGPDGLCVVCKPGEPGEFVGKIKRKDPVRDFDGYADAAASEKKIVRDVFRKGDLAFLSGDILVCDELGYVYFKDRTGDTFRWRGENVSTAEVEDRLSQAADNADAVVFGVEVPSCEGKAGMGVIVTEAPQEMQQKLPQILASLKHSLPGYALPLFLRTVQSIDTTGTFKLKKLDLQKEGFNLPKLVKATADEDGHSLFFLDSKKSQYVPLTSPLLQNILDGKVGL